jgi:DNA-binding NtrC family response regulator
MSAPRLIIAYKDSATQKRVARALATNARTVETTGSAACLMETLLRGSRPVVVLGDGLEEGLSLATLVPLLKQCNPHATIILVAEDLSTSDEFKVRQQGVFYRASRPVCSAGWDELQLAVDCACNKMNSAVTTARVH